MTTKKTFLICTQYFVVSTISYQLQENSIGNSRLLLLFCIKPTVALQPRTLLTSHCCKRARLDKRD